VKGSVEVSGRTDGNKYAPERPRPGINRPGSAGPAPLSTFHARAATSASVKGRPVEVGHAPADAAIPAPAGIPLDEAVLATIRTHQRHGHSRSITGAQHETDSSLSIFLPDPHVLLASRLMDTNTILIIIVILFVLGGGGFYFRRR
jgi:hypothetical protein